MSKKRVSWVLCAIHQTQGDCGNLWFIASQPEVQVTTQTGSWHPKWRTVCWDRALCLHDWMLSLGRWCQNWYQQGVQELLVGMRKHAQTQTLHTTHTHTHTYTHPHTHTHTYILSCTGWKKFGRKGVSLFTCISLIPPKLSNISTIVPIHCPKSQ